MWLFKKRNRKVDNNMEKDITEQNKLMYKHQGKQYYAEDIKNLNHVKDFVKEASELEKELLENYSDWRKEWLNENENRKSILLNLCENDLTDFFKLSVDLMVIQDKLWNCGFPKNYIVARLSINIAGRVDGYYSAERPFNDYRLGYVTCDDIHNVVTLKPMVLNILDQKYETLIDKQEDNARQEGFNTKPIPKMYVELEKKYGTEISRKHLSSLTSLDSCQDELVLLFKHDFDRQTLKSKYSWVASHKLVELAIRESELRDKEKTLLKKK